jgi:hypothetical protein
VKLTEQLGRFPTKLELADGAKAQFLQHDLGRAGTISATTTQRASEGMKQIDRNVYGDFRNGIGPTGLGLRPSEVEEYWISVGDSVVRLAHIQADGQKKTEGTFTVKGQLLRYPGDDSLGATLDNIINCRCSAVETIDEDSIPF